MVSDCFLGSDHSWLAHRTRHYVRRNCSSTAHVDHERCVAGDCSLSTSRGLVALYRYGATEIDTRASCARPASILEACFCVLDALCCWLRHWRRDRRSNRVCCRMDTLWRTTICGLRGFICPRLHLRYRVPVFSNPRHAKYPSARGAH